MKYEKIQGPKGVREYLPPESAAFEWVREQLIAPAKAAGYQLMELPVFEDTNLLPVALVNQLMWFRRRCIPLKIVVDDQLRCVRKARLA